MIFSSNDNTTPNANIVVADNRFKFNLRNGILIFVVLAVVLELGWIYFQVTGKKENSLVPIAERPTTPVMFSVSAPNSEFSVGDSFEAVVSLSVGTANVAGVDAYLTFNPDVLEASSSSIVKTSLFPDYPQTSVLEGGQIRISAISDSKWGFSGDGQLAKITFKAKSLGVSPIKFDFTPGLTTDSNVVSTKLSDDLLEQVSNINIVVK